MQVATIEDTPAETEYLIKPVLPTILGDQEYFDLFPTECVSIAVHCGWVVPGPIDVERLRYAISHALTLHPTAAGRLSYDEGTEKFRLNLNNEGVLLTVMPDCPTPGPWQEGFEHFRHPDLIDSHPLPFDHLAMVDVPLMKFRLVSWPKLNQTMLTTAWSHIAGDAVTGCRVHKTISDFYEGIPLTFTPTYEKLVIPDPALDRGLVGPTMKYLRHMDHAYELSKLIDSVMEMVESTDRVDISLSTNEWQAVHLLAKQTAKSRISRLDALSGYLAYTLNKVSGKAPITKMMQYVGTRGVKSVPGGYQYPPFTSSGNCIQMISADFPAENSSPGAMADAVRNSMLELRDPEVARRVVALQAERHKEQFAKSLALFPPPSDWIGYNNTYKVGFLDPTFGYKNRVRFYKWDNYIENFFSLMSRNPIPLPDGSWDCDPTGIDLMFRIKTDVKPVFLKQVQKDLQPIVEKIEHEQRQKKTASSKL